MRKRVIIAAVLMLFHLLVYSQDKYLIDWDYAGQSFEAFVRETEMRYPVRFFFREEWISDLTLGRYGSSPELGQLLDSLFSGLNVYYYPTGPRNIILTGEYAIKMPEKHKNGDQNYVPAIDYSEKRGSGSPGQNLVMDFGNPADRSKPGSVTLSGYIRNEDTGETVPGVTVFIPALSAGTISNEHGYYTMVLPRGSYNVRYTFIGMRERTVDLNLFGPGELNLEMKNVLVPLKEAVITADKDITLHRMEAGVEKINVASFRMMPTSLGESDIIKSALLIPGVQTVGEGSAGFNVRGGSADQNLILLYGAPVYNSSHFFGFFSAVNPDIIKDVTLYKGGIPARYGGRLSSVMDIVPRDGSRKEFSGSAGLSPVTAHFVAEGPVMKDTLSFLLAGRTTYSNWILGLLDNTVLNNSRVSFHDLNARITYDMDKKNKIDLSAYYSHDSFRYNSDTAYTYLNNIASLRWRHYFSSRFFSALALSNSYYKYGVSSMRVPSEAFSLNHRINSTGFKADFNWFPGRSEINFGADIIWYGVNPGSFMPAHDSSFVVTNEIERQRAAEASVYFEDEYKVNEYLTVSAGLRLSSYFALGPQTIYIYDPELTRSFSSVTDTVTFGGLSSYKAYAGPEMRMSANIRLSGNSSLKLNYNHTRQYLHLLTNTASVSPTDTWKLSDYHLQPQSGDQFGAGFYKMLNNNKIETSAEIYYKKIDNMVDFKGGTDLIMNEHIERDLINVYGKAYGLELLVRKPEGRIHWSASYTYSRVLIRSKGTFTGEMINSGDWFPANFDRPHDLILTFNYIQSRRMSFSANYSFSSGRPVTYPVATYMIEDIVLTHYSDRNKYRLPYYSRLDFSIKVSGDLKSGKIANPHWVFSLYNVTGRQNVYSVFFRKHNNIVKGYYLSVFGRPVPSLSFYFDF